MHRNDLKLRILIKSGKKEWIDKKKFKFLKIPGGLRSRILVNNFIVFQTKPFEVFAPQKQFPQHYETGEL